MSKMCSLVESLPMAAVYVEQEALSLNAARRDVRSHDSHFLQKPFSTKKLLNTVREVLDH